MDVLLIGNDQLITVVGLKDEITGEFINDAAVEVTLKDRSGNEVAGQSWPFTLDYVTDTDGDYRGILEDGLALQPNKLYTVIIDVDAGDDSIANWKFERYAHYRTP